MHSVRAQQGKIRLPDVQSVPGVCPRGHERAQTPMTNEAKLYALYCCEGALVAADSALHAAARFLSPVSEGNESLHQAAHAALEAATKLSILVRNTRRTLQP